MTLTTAPATTARTSKSKRRAKLTPPLKWHGGKQYLAPKFAALMPPRCENPNEPTAEDPGWLHYVEPYFGGGAVLLTNNPEGISEVVNDLNGELVNFWRVLADAQLFPSFQRRIEATPFSEVVWRDAGAAQSSDPVDSAAAFFIRCRQSLSGRMDCFAGVTRNRTRRAMNEQTSAWLGAVEGLPAVHARLQRVLILSRPALELIAKEDGPRTLFYLDPPYLHETRATTGEYAHEMTEDQHRELLETLGGLSGRFMLSGYSSSLYLEYERRQGWTRHEFELPNNAAGGKAKRRMTECLWCNF